MYVSLMLTSDKMTKLEIPAALQRFQEPVTFQRHITPLVLRRCSIIQILLESPSEVSPRLPRKLVGIGKSRLEELEKMIVIMKQTGDCKLFPKWFSCKEGMGIETDYFFVDGSKIKKGEGYEWYPLMNYGQNGLPEGQEGMVLFSSCYSLVTGVGFPDEFV
jgi:hypothetical protein